MTNGAFLLSPTRGGRFRVIVSLSFYKLDLQRDKRFTLTSIKQLRVRLSEAFLGKSPRRGDQSRPEGPLLLPPAGMWDQIQLEVKVGQGV